MCMPVTYDGRPGNLWEGPKATRTVDTEGTLVDCHRTTIKTSNLPQTTPRYHQVQAKNVQIRKPGCNTKKSQVSCVTIIRFVSRAHL